MPFIKEDDEPETGILVTDEAFQNQVLTDEELLDYYYENYIFDDSETDYKKWFITLFILFIMMLIILLLTLINIL